MHHFILLLSSCLIISGLTGCVGVNKSRQNIAYYDFGLPSSNKPIQLITSKIYIQDTLATESLNHNKIRYRLNYQNPTRVFFYSESRWISSPSVLLSGKLRTMADVAKNPLNCSLKLRIEAFDHVFQTASASEGVVQLSAFLVEQKSRAIVASQLITEGAVASAPTAQGGVGALRQASEAALIKAVEWGNRVADNSARCH